MSDNPILAISERAAQLRAAGRDVVSLAAGEPDTATPAHITAAAAAASISGEHHYGPAAGSTRLRAAVADQLPALAPRLTAQDVQICLGTKHALYLAVQAVLSPGQQVLASMPGWPGHGGAVSAAGGQLLGVPGSAENGFLATADELDAACTEETGAVVFASPANPTGSVYSAEQLADIAEWACIRDLWIVSDDVYARFVYDAEHAHLLTVAPHARDRCIVVAGVSKAYAMTGWRIGWLAGPPEVIAAARRHVAQTITHAPHVTQAAALEALTGDQAPQLDAHRRYRAKRDRLVAALDALPGVACSRPPGGMFAFPSISALLTDGTGRWTTSAELAAWLLDTAGVAVVPGEAFDAPGRLRMCFAVSDPVLEAAIARLTAALQHSG